MLPSPGEHVGAGDSSLNLWEVVSESVWRGRVGEGAGSILRKRMGLLPPRGNCLGEFARPLCLFANL